MFPSRGVGIGMAATARLRARSSNTNICSLSSCARGRSFYLHKKKISGLRKKKIFFLCKTRIFVLRKKMIFFLHKKKISSLHKERIQQREYLLFVFLRRREILLFAQENLWLARKKKKDLLLAQDKDFRLAQDIKHGYQP